MILVGKPSDMWALGVVLFTMLYGQFPFYDSVPAELFRKIKSAEFTIPKYLFLSFNCEWKVLNSHSFLQRWQSF